MSSLKHRDKASLEELFDMGGGYVLTFDNRTFAEFFKDFDIDIYTPKYEEPAYTSSKGNLLRIFWGIESDGLVGRVIKELIQLAIKNKSDIDKKLLKECEGIASRLLGQKVTSVLPKDEFLTQKFEFDLQKITMPNELREIIDQRIKEVAKLADTDAYLAIIFLCGSTLEGLLMNHASNNWSKYKQKTGKSQVSDCTLNNLIEAAYGCNDISKQVMDFSHNLRNFRNYIHPFKQMSEKFNPDEHTAKIAWQILQASIVDLSK